MSKSEEFSLDRMLGEIAANLNNPQPNHFQYRPHDKQIQFHASMANGRQFLGGNRSGKTVAGINEDIMWSMGKHLFTELPPPPIYGRIVTVDFLNGAKKIIIPQLKQWIPPSLLKNGSWEDSYDGQTHILTFENDSQIEIMSHEQDLEKFAGVPRHWTHFDEEPPFDIFKECKARLVDYNGRWWMTMTPVEGMTWSYDEIYEKRHTELITVIEVDINDNPHLSEEGRANAMAGYTEDEQEIRGRGKYVAVSGLIFKDFDPDVHIIPAGIPLPVEDWEYWISCDPGLNNPTAIYWHAVRRSDGLVVTFDEHYRSNWTVKEHAAHILEREKYYRDNFGIIPFLRVADPAIKQRSPQTGLSTLIAYSNEGVNFATAKVKDVEAGLDKMIEYLKQRKWFITENCAKLQWEFRRYKWARYSTSKTREQNNPKREPQKKDDHACDSCRYFYSFMPDLTPVAQATATVERPNLLGAPTQVRNRPNNVDTNLLRNSLQQHEGYDEYTGVY